MPEVQARIQGRMDVPVRTIFDKVFFGIMGAHGFSWNSLFEQIVFLIFEIIFVNSFKLHVHSL